MTTISAIRYDVEIQPPSSMPAPIAPWISASDALTIWMLSTAMKAPSVAPTTASQFVAETAGGGGGGGSLAGGTGVACGLEPWRAGVLCVLGHDALRCA